jgi:hypothetical protein
MLFDARGVMQKRSIVQNGITPRAVVAVLAIALVLGAAFLLLTVGLASCATSVVGSIAPQGSARLSIDISIPAPLAEKLRNLSQAKPGAPLFDASAIRKSFENRPGIELLALSEPRADSIRALLSVRSLADLADSPELRGTNLITVSSGPGWHELRVRLERGQAAALTKLFPGIDPYMMDALSPPALEPDPVTVADYRSMLASVLGERVMAALDSARASVSLTVPGVIIDSGGGKIEQNSLSVSIPVIDALVLEKPIEFWIRWRQP